MQATSRWLPSVLLPVLLTIVLAACGSSGPAAVPSTTPAQARLSEDEAIEAAIVQASHIIGDSTPQETSARFTTYAEALAEADLEPSGPPPRADDAPVWLVRLKGLFHEPRPPGVPEPPAACFELIILLDDSTGEYFMLTLPPAEGCS